MAQQIELEMASVNQLGKLESSDTNDYYDKLHTVVGEGGGGGGGGLSYNLDIAKYIYLSLACKDQNKKCVCKKGQKAGETGKPGAQCEVD